MSDKGKTKVNNNEEEDDNTPWVPGDEFEEVFIHMDQNNNCVISGPPNKVAELKEKIANIVLEGHDKVATPRLDNINSFEFQCQ